MSHSYTKLWIHAVLVTKFRRRLIHSDIESELYRYLGEQLTLMKCGVRIINGVEDHIHILFNLNPDKTVAQVMKQLKGGSSHYINSNNLIDTKFQWQTGYGAFSVSESGATPVYYYIRKQKRHHKKVDFADEFKTLVTLYGLELDPNFFKD